MNKIITILSILLFSSSVFSQLTGYYDGVEGKQGDDLKSSLHNIIKGHTVFSYHSAKYIFKLSDADPDNPDNVIQVYTGFSHDNSDYGTGGLTLNREHVWAKSHGNFADWLPMYSDVHNLKPSAAAVNSAKGNKDFDNGGIPNDIATNCYYTDSTWEARDEVKGDIARIIFYMATRYEGGDGEIDLEVVNNNHSYPNAQHGKLTTLVQWNQMDPPDDFERNRNNVIESFQNNRNPFIDNPEWIDLIWGDGTLNPISIDNISLETEIVVSNTPLQISAEIVSSSGNVSEAKILWGSTYNDLVNEVPMSDMGNYFIGEMPGQPEGATIFYRIYADDGTNQKSSVVYNFYVPKIFTGELVSIYDIQGQQEDSPYSGQVVSTTGVVTGNFGTSYFIQNGTGLWNGLFIYESGRNPSIGDSVIVTGEISEYYGKTEMSNLTDYYFISSNNQLPEPVVSETGSIEEGHESIIVKVTGATCTDENYQSNYYMWKVNDGSGSLNIHNTNIFEYNPIKGFVYDIQGPMNYDFDEWKIELRYENDVVSSQDLNGPVVIEVIPVISTNIRVMFDEQVEAASGEDMNNYSIDKGVIIESISQHSFNKAQVNLTVSSMIDDSYILTVKNVRDLIGNIMSDQEFEFSFVGVNELFTDDKLDIYPIPSTNKVNISLESKEEMTLKIKILDMNGRTIYQKDENINSGSNKLSIDISNYKAGTYLLSLSSRNAHNNHKLLIK
ncbi:MAG: T9SS type A sorting domain-containing protein [Lentimicrobiaceae bacterium]|jgi:endonuclease I|nr:T9SS type A sorting domain-containing protein [Lentimicrobiaceae bacterium]MBT3454704.1 T9SS type A sorting domain-containing protein [Lentimicrobiaceae bacterium]MBT3819692.1 T9SS type A sorting domain-containing protein [Lentimicrobiaceae bacterium]MBT4061230.1 T9SS type A sorting domain-containing protein [Lentimicrobiaceae bacterium]MBT4191389.1 T9SS type A sorting domain-containing protein [Lentimicrobiaceae bacterium]